MNPNEPIYILGAGAMGLPLAFYLTQAGQPVIAVRTSRHDLLESEVVVNVHDSSGLNSASIKMVSLARLDNMKGTVVVTAKAHANSAIAAELIRKQSDGTLVILQNGIGVEQPFLETRFAQIYRCVLYITSQAIGAYAYKIRPITSSPMGILRGDATSLSGCLEILNTLSFPFHQEDDIQKEAWKKTVINAVFNSICPLLEIDNGVFFRDEQVARLAREIIGECVALTNRLGFGFDESEFMSQLMKISQGSDGQLISTLQDIRTGQPTEIESLNLELARVASELSPPLLLPRTEILGRMVLAKSRQTLRL